MRRERRAEQARINRLDRVLRMLSGVNGLLVRVRDRKELLSEVCRLAVAIGGYAASIAYYKVPGTPGPKVLGCNGRDPATTEALRKAVSEPHERGPSVIDQVIKSGNVFICTDTPDPKGRVEPAVGDAASAVAFAGRATVARGQHCLGRVGACGAGSGDAQ